MRKRTLLTLLVGLPLLAMGALAACEDEEEPTGLGDVQALAQAGESGMRHLARLQEELDLTDAQVAEIRTIFEEQRTKIRALHENAPEDPEARRDAFRELRDETHVRMSAVLTEEQRQRLQEHIESRGHRGAHGKHGPHGAWDPEGHLTRLQEKLDLTDRQVTELRAIFGEQREKIRALHESTPEDREARREAFMELRTETHERMSAVLTEEQRERFEELMQSHKGSHEPRGAWQRGAWHRRS